MSSTVRLDLAFSASVMPGLGARQLDGGISQRDDGHVGLLLVLGTRLRERYADFQTEEIHVDGIAIGKHLKIENLANTKPITQVDKTQVFKPGI